MVKRILVIDDEPDVLEIVRAVLNTKGHDVVTALGGEAGLIEAAAQTPDLIISDLMMPRVSGLEVIKRLRASETLRAVPIIILSALGDDDKHPPEFWIRSLGVDDYIHKPFDPLDLLGRVEYIFRRKAYISASATRPGAATHDSDTQTSVPIDVRTSEPQEVVKAFVECWNRQDFATEFHCLSEEMTRRMNLHEYVSLRRGTYMEEKGQGRRQRVVDVVEVKVSVNVAKVTVDREDTANGQATRRREIYTLKKTHQGWKILNCRVDKQ